MVQAPNESSRDLSAPTDVSSISAFLYDPSTTSAAPEIVSSVPAPNDVEPSPRGDEVPSAFGAPVADTASAPTPGDLPWLDTSAEQLPAPHEALPFPPYEHTAANDAAPEEAAQALAGLPYFDGLNDGSQGAQQPHMRASGKMHRIEFDLAGVLERVAARVRDGELTVTDVDPLAGDGAALAAVLAALLRQRS